MSENADSANPAQPEAAAAATTRYETNYSNSPSPTPTPSITDEPTLSRSSSAAASDYSASSRSSTPLNSHVSRLAQRKSPFQLPDLIINNNQLARSRSNAALNSAPFSPLSSPSPVISTSSNPFLDPLLLSRSSSSAVKARREPSASAIPIFQPQSHAAASHLIAPNLYIQQRVGGLLSRGMVLKSDHIPADKRGLEFECQIIGAPNFHQIKPFRVYGVGQPSVSGTRGILNLLHTKNNPDRRVKWINLREEPVIYLNNRPFVLRESDYPFHNMNDFSGIEPTRLALIESRLESDILSEGENNFGNILVHDEQQLGEIRSCWESVDPQNVKTSQAMYKLLRSEGYGVTLLRVPVTAESVFEPEQFDSIVNAFTESIEEFEQNGTETFFVMNDQLGRGRSAVGLVLLTLLHSQLTGLTPDQLVSKLGPSAASDHRLSSANLTLPTDRFTQYSRGEYEIILKLIRMLPNGQTAKSLVDLSADLCGKVHHIRYAILESLLKSEHSNSSATQKSYNSVTASHLKRYFFLICFASWLSELPRQSNLFADHVQNNSFSHWMAGRGELQKLASTLITEESLKELFAEPTDETGAAVEGASVASEFALDKMEKAETGDLVGSSLSAEECSLMDSFVFQRCGAVLSQRTIVKSEFVDDSNFVENLGAHNFRHLKDLPLSATGQPNASGIREIVESLMENLGIQPDEQRGPLIRTNSFRDAGNHIVTITSQLRSEESLSHLDGKIIWINLREEPVVFLSDECYLLRDYSHPFRVLTEFNTGMTAQRSEQVEDGLKRDILAEWRSSGEKKAILVHQETSQRQIKPKFIGIEGESKVETTRELFDRLRLSGLPIDYHRVPLHVEEVPGLKSFDRLFSLLCDHKFGSKRASVVFNDQKGGRRSTMGMIVATLLLMHQGGLQVKIESEKNGKVSSQTEEKIEESKENDSQLNSAAAALPSTSVDLNSQVSIDFSPSDHDRLRHRYGGSDYKGILNLIRIIKHGRSVKEEVDLAVDMCGSVHNIRDAIADAKDRADTDRAGDVQKGHLFKALKYLESYAYLICFNAYLHDRKEQFLEHKQAEEKRMESKAKNAGIKEQTEKPAAEAQIQRNLSNEFQGSDKQSSNVAELADYNRFNPYIESNRDEKRVDEVADEKHVGFASPIGSEVFSDSDDSEPESDSFLFLSSSARGGSTFSFPSFSAWISSRPELRLALEHLRLEPDNALKTNFSMSDEQFSAVFEARNGNVLVRGSILKSDYFSGVVNKNIEQIVEGAINFRPIDKFPVAGTGIPTVAGIVNILNFYTQQHTDESKYKPLFRSSAMLWLNLREEPLIYVNNRPFVLRDSDNPYVNLENTGITARRIEAMEKTLQSDAMAELKRAGGDRMLLHDEDESGNLFGYWENSRAEEIKTPKEQFYSCFRGAAEKLRSSGGEQFNARYYRTPITDEQAPSPATLDDFVRYLESGIKEERRTLIMNCQMGRGRTTTGLIIACLWCIHRRIVDPSIVIANAGKVKFASFALANESLGKEDGEERVESGGAAASLRAGWWKIVNNLVRLLDDGPAIKRQTDSVIDWCGSMQNLRDVVYETQVNSLSCLPRKRPFFVRRGTNYLIRYFMLILINAYFHSEKHTNFQRSFVDWLNQRKEFVKILENVQFPEGNVGGAKV